MKRLERGLLVLCAVGLIAVLAGAGAVVAGGADGDKVERKATTRIVVVDGDGTRHEESFEFDGTRPFLGVNLDGTGGEGARVDHVIADTAAERAGLQEGDIIVEFDGEKIDSPRDLTRSVLRSKPGSSVEIGVERDGRAMTLTGEVGERDLGEGFAFDFDMGDFADQMGRLGEHLGEMDFDFDFDSDSFEESMEQLHEHLGGMEFDSEEFQEKMERLGERLEKMDLNFGPHGAWAVRSARPLLGVRLVEATPDLREHLGGDRDEGVLVGAVTDGMPADTAGVQVGDLIVAIDDQPIESTGDLRRALRERQGGRFDIEVIRDGRRKSLAAALPARATDEEGGIPGAHERRHPHGSAPSALDRT